MQLQPHAERPDPELWLAVHEAPAAMLKRNQGDARAWPHQLHGMPADRLAMAASRLPRNAPQGKWLR